MTSMSDEETQLVTNPRVDNRPCELRLRECMINFNCCGYIAFIILTKVVNIQPGQPCPDYDEEIYYRAREMAEHNYDHHVKAGECNDLERLLPECTEDDVEPFLATRLHIDDLKFIAHACGNWKFMVPDRMEIDRYMEKFNIEPEIVKIMLSEFVDRQEAIHTYVQNCHFNILHEVHKLLHAADKNAAHKQLVQEMKEMQRVIVEEFDDLFSLI